MYMIMYIWTRPNHVGFRLVLVALGCFFLHTFGVQEVWTITYVNKAFFGLFGALGQGSIYPNTYEALFQGS